MADAPADGVKVRKRIVEMESEDERVVLKARSKAATCQGVATMPERAYRLNRRRVALNGATSHDLVNPSFSAAGAPSACTELSQASQT